MMRLRLPQLPAPRLGGLCLRAATAIAAGPRLSSWSSGGGWRPPSSSFRRLGTAAAATSTSTSSASASAFKSPSAPAVAESLVAPQPPPASQVLQNPAEETPASAAGGPWSFAAQPYTRVESFDFKHYYHPMHPRLTDEHGMMFPQSSRNQWFWASFALCIFELRYRVFHYAGPLVLPGVAAGPGEVGVSWVSVPPRPGLSFPGYPSLAELAGAQNGAFPQVPPSSSAAAAPADAQEPPLTPPVILSDGRHAFSLGSAAAGQQAGLVSAWDARDGRLRAQLQLPPELVGVGAYLRQVRGPSGVGGGSGGSPLSPGGSAGSRCLGADAEAAPTEAEAATFVNMMRAEEDGSCLLLLTDRMCKPLAWLEFRESPASLNASPSSSSQNPGAVEEPDASLILHRWDLPERPEQLEQQVQEELAALSPDGRHGLRLEANGFQIFPLTPAPPSAFAASSSASASPTSPPSASASVGLEAWMTGAAPGGPPARLMADPAATSTSSTSRRAHGQQQQQPPQLQQQQLGDLPFLRSSSLLIPRRRFVANVASSAAAANPPAATGPAVGGRTGSGISWGACAAGTSCSSRLATEEPPLVLLTSRTTAHGVSTAFLHAYDPVTDSRQTLCWSPDEGWITGIGYSHDGNHVFVAVTKNQQHLVFEFPVKPRVT